MTTYRKIYDPHYKHLHVGYEFDGGRIDKDMRTSWNGNTIVEGFIVVIDGKRALHTGTLKEAKEYVEYISENGFVTSDEYWRMIIEQERR